MNQQLTTVTEEIEELKSRKEQLIFQAECSTDKDMTNLSKKYDQLNNHLDILDSQDIFPKKQLKKDAAAFREEKFHPEPEQRLHWCQAPLNFPTTFLISHEEYCKLVLSTTITDNLIIRIFSR